MRTLLVSHYFPPEVGAPQVRLSTLARTWAADGDTVTVLTGMPHYPTGVVPPPYRGAMRCAIRRLERWDGCRVVRTWVYAVPNTGVVRRTLEHLSFMISSVLLGWRACGPADVVVVSSPTFFSIGAAWLLARVKRARFVIEIRDLWPAIFVQLGVLTNRRVLRLLERFELAAYSAADAIVVVSDGFRANLTDRGVPADKIHTIPNGANLDLFDRAATADPAVRARLGAQDDECLVLYAGTHGISQALPVLADAVARLADEPVHFAFVGEGAEKQLLQRKFEELGLRNVTLLPGVPHREMPALLAAADVCLVALRNVPLHSKSIPSKIFEYLAAEKAVVGAVAGEAAQILREAGAVVVPMEDTAELAEAIAKLAANPERRRAMGEQGRSHVEHFFDRIELARQYRKILSELCRRR